MYVSITVVYNGRVFRDNFHLTEASAADIFVICMNYLNDDC